MENIINKAGRTPYHTKTLFVVLRTYRSRLETS